MATRRYGAKKILDGCYDETMAGLTTTAVAGMQFANLLLNGAYIGSKSAEDIATLVASSAGAVVVGSISVLPRGANPGHGYWRHRERFYSLNSYGMPNGGLPYFQEHLPNMARLAHTHQKPLIANIVGFQLKDFAPLIELAEAARVDMIEVNLGCPNVWDGSTQKRIISYHPALVEGVLHAIAGCKPTLPLSIKISPVPPDTLQDLAHVFARSGMVSAVTATNSYPNASITAGTRVNGEELLAGLTGRSLKPISLGIVKQLRTLLPADIAIIGCGGISSYNDVVDYLAAGAAAVQIATALVDEGPSVFEKIAYQAELAG